MRSTIALVILVQAVVWMLTGCSRASHDGRFGSLEVSGARERPGPAAIPEDALLVPYLETPPVINGDLSDWKGMSPISLGTADAPVHGRAWLAWDLDRFYLACEIVDPRFRNAGVADTASLEHCVIFDFDGLFGTAESSPERMTFALTRRGAATSWDILHRDDPGACVVKKTSPDTYVYEIALSWHDVQPIAPGLNRGFGFDLLYQYLDDGGRTRCVRWQQKAGTSPGRRTCGAAVLAPMPDRVRGTHLYVGPKTFTVAQDGTLTWPVLLALEKGLEDAELTAEFTAGEGEEETCIRGVVSRDFTPGLHYHEVTWRAKGVPGGTYELHTTLKDASNRAAAADFFRAHKRAPLDVAAEYENLERLRQKLVRSGNRFYKKDADSVDVMMEAVKEHADRTLDPTSTTQLERMVKNTREIMEAMLAGHDYYGEVRGYVIRGFRSPYDDTLQFYELFVPRDYDPKKTYPLMINLHGAGGNVLNTLDGTYTAHYFPDPDWQYLRVVPFARGRSGYQGLGLTEVLDTIGYVKGLYNVDEDRVTLKGFSMGGAGTWKIALQYPHLFAAANPRAGFVGYDLYDRLQKDDAERDWKTALAMAYAPMFLAENAGSLPIYLYHGGSDPTIPAENTYRMWDRLRGLGGELGIWIYHHYQHVWAKDMDGPANEFMLKYRRERYPDRVIYRTAHLHFHRAYWVTVERLGDPLHMAEIDCLKQSDGSVMVEAENVEAFSLDLPPEVIPGTRVEVTVNGTSVHTGEIPEGRRMFFEKAGDAWRVGRRPGPSDRVKQPGLSGPMDDAFFGRVLYVYGTRAEDAELNTELKKLAEERCGRSEPDRYLSRKRHGFYPVKADSEVTEEDIRHAHLVLIGGPAENLVTKRMARDLPVTLRAHAFTFRGREYTGETQGIKFIYPNPLSPGRYVVVTAANSIEGYRATTDLRRNIPDWAITEGPYSRSGENVKEAGFFSNQWE